MEETRAYVLAMLVLTLLILIPIGSSLLVGTVTLPNSGTISSNKPAYTISISEGIAHVSDGYSNARATLAFVHAFGLVKNGGTITVGPGTYVASWEYTNQGSGAPLYSWFAMENCSNVIVDFEEGAILTIPNGGSSSAFIVWYCTNITFNNLHINGNAANQGLSQTTDGILIYDSSNILVANATIWNCRTYGWATGNNYNYQTAPNGIVNSTVYNCYWNGICLAADDSSVGNYAINNNVYNCSDVGISQWYGRNIKILNNYVHDINGTYGWAGPGTGSHYGIVNEGGKYGVYANNLVTNCPALGIGLGTGNIEWGTLVTNNTIINCAQGVACSNNGFNTITNNVIIDWSTSYGGGVYINNGTNNIVSFNTLLNDKAGFNKAILIEDAWNTSICNNTITFPSDVGVGIDVGVTSSGGTHADDTLVQGNIIQARYGIITESNNARNTVINQNTLGNCTTPITDSGTGTIINPTSSSTYRLFFNNHYDGTSRACTTYANTSQVTLSTSQILNIDGVDVTSPKTIAMNRDHFGYVYPDYSSLMAKTAY